MYLKTPEVLSLWLCFASASSLSALSRPGARLSCPAARIKAA